MLDNETMFTWYAFKMFTWLHHEFLKNRWKDEQNLLTRLTKAVQRFSCAMGMQWVQVPYFWPFLTVKNIPFMDNGTWKKDHFCHFTKLSQNFHQIFTILFSLSSLYNRRSSNVNIFIKMIYVFTKCKCFRLKSTCRHGYLMRKSSTSTRKTSETSRRVP